MLPVTYNPDTDSAPAVPGMLADSGFTDKITVPCGAAPQPFGTVVGTVAATGISVLPVGANLAGIALQDHAYAGRRITQDGYVQYDAMSVIARGRVWALASGTCTKDAVAKYDPATGVFADSGTATYPNAKFLTGAVQITGILSSNPAARIVQVELHNPTV